MEQFINHNGTIQSSNECFALHNNRSFRYGDSIFETIRITNHKTQFLAEHLKRLQLGIKILKMQYPEYLTEQFLEEAISVLAQKNGITSDGRVRITIYRNSGGFYSPTDNTVSYLIELEKLETEGYDLNFKGYTVDLFNEYKKQQHPLSTIKTGSSLVYVLAGIHKSNQQLDDCILLNDSNHIIESINSNIFAVKNGVLYTPPVTEGCVDGVMRKKIIEIAQANRIAVYEISILQNVLLSADELFLTNAIQGIRWIVAYKQKRYFNNTSKKFVERLNQMVGINA